MVAKRLKGGVAYYWERPTWARRAGCPVKGEALGTDYAVAKQCCDELLNPQFDAWRTRGDVGTIEHRPTPGTFDWMVSVYKSLPKYTTRRRRPSDRTMECCGSSPPIY